jgi:hypothetical protein
MRIDRVPTFKVFEKEVSDKGDRNNYSNYLKGKEPLKNAVLLHPDGDEVFNYVWNNINRTFWLYDRDKVQSGLKKKRRIK